MALRRPILCLLTGAALLSCFNSKKSDADGPFLETCFDTNYNQIVESCDLYRECLETCDPLDELCADACYDEEGMGVGWYCMLRGEIIADDCRSECPCWSEYNGCAWTCVLLHDCDEDCGEILRSCNGRDIEIIVVCVDGCRTRHEAAEGVCMELRSSEDWDGWMECEVSRHVTYGDCFLSCY